MKKSNRFVNLLAKKYKDPLEDFKEIVENSF